ncbi:hypothetical protein PR048_013620 [Dryococelus australis]|uniref:Uncharacterized protein n=1 Tax=Dryococelus australis TaxID=614101 RepID=A0ABQ9HT03_9NEOP|nr:hypothetical protein PR048_013620 [Dryococelus australis]
MLVGVLETFAWVPYMKFPEVVDHAVFAVTEVDSPVDDAVVAAEQLTDTSAGTVNDVTEEEENKTQDFGGMSQVVHGYIGTIHIADDKDAAIDVAIIPEEVYGTGKTGDILLEEEIDGNKPLAVAPVQEGRDDEEETKVFSSFFSAVPMKLLDRTTQQAFRLQTYKMHGLRWDEGNIPCEEIPAMLDSAIICQYPVQLAGVSLLESVVRCQSAGVILLESVGRCGACGTAQQHFLRTDWAWHTVGDARTVQGNVLRNESMSDFLSVSLVSNMIFDISCTFRLRVVYPGITECAARYPVVMRNTLDSSKRKPIRYFCWVPPHREPIPGAAIVSPRSLRPKATGPVEQGHIGLVCGRRDLSIVHPQVPFHTFVYAHLEKEHRDGKTACFARRNDEAHLVPVSVARWMSCDEVDEGLEVWRNPYGREVSTCRDVKSNCWAKGLINLKNQLFT